MAEEEKPAFVPAPFGDDTERAGEKAPFDAKKYQAERDRAAAKVIFESMDRKLHGGRALPRKSDDEFDPHEW